MFVTSNHSKYRAWRRAQDYGKQTESEKTEIGWGREFFFGQGNKEKVPEKVPENVPEKI